MHNIANVMSRGRMELGSAASTAAGTDSPNWPGQRGKLGKARSGLQCSNEAVTRAGLTPGLLPVIINTNYSIIHSIVCL